MKLEIISHLSFLDIVIVTMESAVNNFLIAVDT